MPAAMTYTSLTTSVQNYCVRGGATVDATFNTELPGFINLTEQQIARELKIQGLQNSTVSTMTASLGVYQKPNRWRATVSINIGTGTNFNTRKTLLPRSYEYCRTYWPDDTATDEPEFYADYGYEDILIVPTPTLAHPFELNFWELPPPLDATLQTNFFTQYAPNALLDGTLVRAFNFLKNQEQAAAWQQTFDRDMAGLAGEDLQKILDRSQKRTTS